MLWEVVNNLKNERLDLRAIELRQCLERLADHDLVVFHQEALAVFRSLFTPQIYRLYSIAFDGETNGTGLTDFCSNLMLAGRSLTDAVVFNPDNFATVEQWVTFNDDNDLNMTSIAGQILTRRHDEDAVELMFRELCVDSLDGIWEGLESEAGLLNFEPDWQLAGSALPRICRRMGH